MLPKITWTRVLLAFAGLRVLLVGSHAMFVGWGMQGLYWYWLAVVAALVAVWAWRTDNVH